MRVHRSTLRAHARGAWIGMACILWPAIAVVADGGPAARVFLPQDALRGRAPRQNLGNVTRVGGGGPDAADSRSAGALIGVGIGLGVIHVLTGPDHVSAIVTLSVGGSFRAFWLGVRWGLGHSVGLLLMYSAFVEFGSSALQGNSTIAVLAHATVGVFMIVLGITGCNSAFKQVIRLYIHMCVHVCVCVCVCVCIETPVPLPHSHHVPACWQHE